MEENKYTFENPEFKNTYRHTTSHILAQAVKRLYPEVKRPSARLSTTAFTMTLTLLCHNSRDPRKDRGRDAQDLQGKDKA